MSTHQPVSKPTEYGNATSFWVEYPSGLIDLSRSRHVSDVGEVDLSPTPSLNAETQIDIPVDKERTVRIDKGSSAIVIIDMQKYVVVTVFKFLLNADRTATFFTQTLGIILKD